MGVMDWTMGFLSTTAARDVGALYSMLGYDVQQGVELMGQQIDLLVQRVNSKTRTAIEVKGGYESPITQAATENFAAVVEVLKNAGLIHEAAIVSSSGFTSEARDYASSKGIAALNLDELRKKARDQIDEHEKALKELQQFERVRREGVNVLKRRVFVLMPFAKEFVDVYVYGIRKVADDLGHVADRADDIEHNDYVMRVVTDRIQEADAIVADITGCNANVFYEVGYAHACRRPVILICRKGENVPFDLEPYNCITYETITELEEKLGIRLKATLGDLKSPHSDSGYL